MVVFLWRCCGCVLGVVWWCCCVGVFVVVLLLWWCSCGVFQDCHATLACLTSSTEAMLVSKHCHQTSPKVLLKRCLS